MALCDYFELVTTVIVTSVWAPYFIQAMVTSSGLLDIYWLCQGLAQGPKMNQISHMVVVKLLKFIGSE